MTMTFNEHINIGFNTYNLNERQDKINNMLLSFTDNMVDLSKVNYTINGYNLITGWDITLNDEYTENIFHTEHKTLNRKIKISKLISDGF